MNITITGRHFEVTPSLRDYAEKKIKKVEKYFHQLIDSHVVMYIEKLNHVVELTINGDGAQFYGMEKAGDMYSSVDLLLDKIEKQIVKYKEKHSGHKAVALGKMEMAESADEGAVPIQVKKISIKPLGEVEALLEMRMDRRDFILFRKGSKEVKKENKADNAVALIYAMGKGLKMAEMPVENKGKKKKNPVVEYDLIIKKDSPTNPKIELKKKRSVSLKQMTAADAMRELTSAGAEFFPFFNTETGYFNVIFKNGKKYAIMTPAR